jgi:proton glutamate symport protein
MPEFLTQDPVIDPAAHPAGSLPKRIVLGAVLGIAAGIVLGDRAAILQPIGDAYGAMLQIAVFPYLLCTLMYSLGRLTSPMALRLLRAGWVPFVFLWILTLATIWVLAYAIPPAPAPFALTASALHDKSNLMQLLIPSNPFSALRKNYVPAVVIFAIIYGVAFQGVAKKQTLLEIFEAVKIASVKIWGWVVRLAPFGVFALLANTAGTVRLDQLAGLAFYTVTYLLGAAILGLVVIPALLSALVPRSYGEILRQIRPALVLAVATTLSVVALPFVQRAAKTILDGTDCVDSEERANVLETSLSLSYVFAQLGNYFVYLLILYASYVAAVPLRLAEKIMLPLMTLLSCLGSPSATYDSVIFLSKWLHLPASVFDLYVETSAITRFAQVIVSVSGFYFITLVIPLLYFKKVRFRPVRFVAGIGGAAVLCACVAFCGFTFRHTLFPNVTSQYAVLKLDPRLTDGVKWTIERADETASSAGGDPGSVSPSIANIRKRGVLRVGFNPHAIPFSYRNAQGELVGFDISYAYRLARDLGVAIEFVPFTPQALARDLSAHRFDVAMSGIPENDERLQSLTMSPAYYESPLALIVPSDGAAKFLDGNAALSRPGLKLAVVDDSVLLPLSQSLFPKAQLIIIPDYESLPGMMTRIEGAVWTLQQATAWAAEHPGFTAVAPENLSGLVPAAYAMAPDAGELGAYVSEWLQLRKADGFRTEQIAYWMKPTHHQSRVPRWNLIDFLLQRYGSGRTVAMAYP